MKTNLEPKLLRYEQASSALGVSHWTLRAWARAGRIRTVRLGKLRLVPINEVKRIERCGIAPTEVRRCK